MHKIWVVIKHSLGTYSDEDTVGHDNYIGAIRFFIVMTNILFAYFFMGNLIFGWF